MACNSLYMYTMALVEKHRTSTFCSNNGQDVFYRNWISDHKPKGIILIVHGLKSHSGYYQNFASELNENFYEVYAIDLPGRGLSDGERYYISDYKEILEDIGLLLNIAKSAHPALPIFLLGHCAGGVFASIFAAHHQIKLKGLICESFTFHVPVCEFVLSTIKFLSKIIPHCPLIQLKTEYLTRDKLLVDIINTDPLLASEKLQVKTIQQLSIAVEYLKNEMSDITLPLLLLHGTADKVSKVSGSEYFMEHASSVDRQLKIYEGHYHDLISDKYNGIIIRDIMNWLNERV
jgi:acylglycerol lipase